MAITVEFDETELSRDYTEVAHGGPVFATSIVGNDKAIQQRSVSRLDAVREYQIDFGGLNKKQKILLEAFFVTKFGKAVGFRFFPPTDNEFQNDYCGRGDGVETVFWMRRNYVSGSRVTSRQICKPVTNKVVVTLDGEVVKFLEGVTEIIPSNTPAGSTFSPLKATIDWNQGQITFNSAPPTESVVRCLLGEYDVPVFFETDKWNSDDFATFSDWNGVGLREILPVALGVGGLGSFVVPETEIPAVSITLVLVSKTYHSMTVNWTATTEIEVTGYQYRLNGGSWTNFDSTSGTSTMQGILLGLSASTEYEIEVRAKDGAGNFSAPSNLMTVTTNDFEIDGGDADDEFGDDFEGGGA